MLLINDLKRQSWVTIVPAVIVSSVMALVLCFQLDVWLEDYAVTEFSDWPDPQGIVLVTVSEDTLATLSYRSPIDRSFLADIVRHIDRAGARAIGLDILIDQPSEPDKDALLFAVLENAGAPIVVGYAGETEGLTQKQETYLNNWTSKLDRGLVTLNRDDFDGTIRQIFTGRKIEGFAVSGLAAALAIKAGTEPNLPSGRITYYRTLNGTPYEFPTYPAHTVQLIPQNWFKDKFVLIGSALPTADLHRTPFSTKLGTEAGSLYGMAIHAHMLAQILSGHRIVTLSGIQTVLLVLGVSIAAVFIAILPTRPVFRAALLSGLLTGLVIVAWILFRQSQILIPVVTPAVAGVLTALILALREWHQDRQGRQFVESAFAQYVSPAVVNRIIDKRESLVLGGEVRRVTYVFTDLQGFTTMCEGLEPERVAALLNDYLDRMCELFIERDATIDKIIGDAVVGFFGAPEEQEDQCDRAVGLALAIDTFAERYKQEKQTEGIDFGTTRIGVHTGDAVVGNFGGTRFVDYTSIGDTVNSAARMESVNKYLGTRMCVSEAVTRECPNHSFRPVGKIFLKGKLNEITCFEPLHPGRLSKQLLADYDDAYTAMEDLDEDASADFTRLASAFPNDPLAALHARRLRAGEVGATIVMQEK